MQLKHWKKGHTVVKNSKTRNNKRTHRTALETNIHTETHIMQRNLHIERPCITSRTYRKEQHTGSLEQTCVRINHPSVELVTAKY